MRVTPAKARALGLPAELVGTWWSPSMPVDVRNEQDRVRTAFSALNTALAASPPKGDPTEVNLAVTAYNGLSKKVTAYLAEDPSTFWWTRDTQVTNGRDYEAQIESWRQKFAGMQVAVPAAPVAAPAAGPPTGTDIFGLGNIAEGLKWAVIGYLAFQFLRR